MLQEKVLLKVDHELKNKTWALTRQFLDVHDIVYIDGQPKIDRIDADDPDGTIIAYIRVKDESFHFAIYFDNSQNLTISFIGTEPYSAVYFRATSNELSLDQLASSTTLSATGGWNVGDKRKLGAGNYSFSSFKFEPNPEPDRLEDKLKKLLSLLEQDKEQIRTLCEKANGHIQVAVKFHNGNTMLGGVHLDKTTIQRLNDLQLSIDFDLYAEGNLFKE